MSAISSYYSKMITKENGKELFYISLLASTFYKLTHKVAIDLKEYLLTTTSVSAYDICNTIFPLRRMDRQ